MVDYVEKAEKVMKGLGRPDRFDKSKLRFNLTTSKIRNILSMVSDIYNAENLSQEDNLSEKSISKIQVLRVKMLYEAGREDSVKDFIEKAGLINEIKAIGKDRGKFLDFARYMEALVAYHRYLGGSET